MRKLVEEKKRQRLLAAEQQASKDKEVPKVSAEPCGKEAEPRQRWAEPQQPPELAQQADVTATLGEGERWEFCPS